MKTVQLGTFTGNISNGDGDSFYTLMAKTSDINGVAVPCYQFASLNAAVADIGANTATLVISGTVALTGNLTIPANVAVRINRGGLVNAGSYTLTINGPLHAGLYQVFGTGTFLFGKGTLQHCHPQWWGAYSDGTNGSATATAIQAAHDSGAKVFFVPGKYLISSTVYYKSNAHFEGAGRCGSGWIDGGSTVLDGGVALIAASGITMFQTYATTGASPSGMVYQATFRNLSFYVSGKGAGGGTSANYLASAVAIDVTGSESIRIKGVDFHNFDKAIYARTADFGSGAGSQYTARFFLDDFTAQECGSIVYLSDKLYAAILPHADITITNGTYTRFCGTSARGSFTGSQFYITGCDGFTMSDITSFPSFGHGCAFRDSVNVRLAGVSMFEGEADNLNFKGCTLVSGSGLVLMRAGWTNAGSANNIGLDTCTNVALHADCERPRGSNINIVASRDVSLHGTYVGAFYGLRTTGGSGQAIYIDATTHNVGIFGTVEGTITDTYETDPLQYAVNCAAGAYGIGGCIAADVPVVNAPLMVVTGASAVSSAPFELALGNPGTSGYVLSSTSGGVRSWVAPGSGGVTSVSGTAPVVSSGGTTPAISMAKATSSVDGYLSKTDWTTFNNKGSGTVTSVTGSAPISSSGGTTPAISIAQAGTSTSGYLSSTDWNTFNSKGTVTAVTGSGCISSSGGTTPQISISQASSTVNGYLSAGDWTSFNARVSSVSGSSPISSSGGQTPTISISQAGSGANGYLSSTDWNTFNNKAPTASPTFTGTVTVADQLATTPKTASVASSVDVSGATLIVLTSGSGTINYFTNYVTNQVFTVLNATGSTVTISNAGGNWTSFSLVASAAVTIVHYSSGLYKAGKESM